VVENIKEHGSQSPDKLLITGECSAVDESQENCRLILCRDINSATELNNSIYLETDKPANEIFLELREWWNRKSKANEIRLQMYQALTEKQYMDMLIDIAFLYLNNPVIIVDHTHQLIKYRQEAPVPIPLWQVMIDSGRYDLSYVDDSFYAGYLKSIHSREVLEFRIEGGNVYTCSIMCNDIYMGSTSLLEYDRDVTEFDLEILKTLSDIISVKMEQMISYPIGTEYQYSQIIIDLLIDRINTEKDLDFRMQTRKWQPKLINRILLFNAKTRDESLAQNIKHSFSGYYPDLKSVVFDDDMLVLYETNLQDEAVPELEEFCKHYNVQVGISEPFGNLLDTQIYYGQTKKALQYGRPSEDTKDTYYYRDFILEDIAQQLCALSSFQQFYHPAVLKLQAFDKENGSDFAETFYTYIEQNRSVNKTGIILHQHRNTVNYRIQRVKELFDIDLNDFKELAHIYLSYKMLVAQGHKDT
jgi:hypothetical protein